MDHGRNFLINFIWSIWYGPYDMVHMIWFIYYGLFFGNCQNIKGGRIRCSNAYCSDQKEYGNDEISQSLSRVLQWWYKIYSRSERFTRTFKLGQNWSFKTLKSGYRDAIPTLVEHNFGYEMPAVQQGQDSLFLYQTYMLYLWQKVNSIERPEIKFFPSLQTTVYH